MCCSLLQCVAACVVCLGDKIGSDLTFERFPPGGRVSARPLRGKIRSFQSQIAGVV